MIPTLTSEQLAALPLYDSIRGTIERFGIGDTKLRELGAQGLIETRKFGKKVLVSQSSVLAYLQSLPQRVPSPQPIERAKRGRFQSSGG